MGFLAFFAAWLGGGVFLCARVRAKQNDLLSRYARDIKFFLGDPLYFPGSLSALEDISRVQRQPNPETERVRREMWRRYRQMLAWGFGFPRLVAAAYAAAIILSRSHL